MTSHEQSSDLEKVTNALVLIEDLKLRTAHEDWELIVPPDILPRRALAWGIPVRHMPGIDCIYVAKRTEIRETALFRRALMGGPQEGGSDSMNTEDDIVYVRWDERKACTDRISVYSDPGMGLNTRVRLTLRDALMELREPDISACHWWKLDNLLRLPLLTLRPTDEVLSGLSPRPALQRDDPRHFVCVGTQWMRLAADPNMLSVWKVGRSEKPWLRVFCAGPMPEPWTLDEEKVTA